MLSAKIILGLISVKVRSVFSQTVIMVTLRRLLIGSQIIPCHNAFHCRVVWTIFFNHDSLCNSLPQFPLIFVICISCNADQLHAIGVVQCAAKVPAVLLNGFLAGSGFFNDQLMAGLLANPTLRDIYNLPVQSAARCRAQIAPLLQMCERNAYLPLVTALLTGRCRR